MRPIAPLAAMLGMLGDTGTGEWGPGEGPEEWELELRPPWYTPPDPNQPPPEEPDPGPELPPGFVAPGPTELHPERWDLDDCTYTVAYGDTYVGIAKTYLDDTGVRWRELWDLNRDTTPNPDRIEVGQTLRMSAEACQNMRRWVGKGGPGGTLPSQTKGGGGGAGWLLGGGLAAALGVYLLS